MEIREFTIDEEGKLGVSAVALVANPATQVQFQTFNESKRIVFNEEQRIITGVAMVPDLPIYRRDESGEYYGKFSKDTIERIAINFFKNQLQNNVNKEHSQIDMLQGVHVFESFIVDSKRGVSAPEWQKDAIEGTWFLSYKVENDEVWNEAKKGTFKGFSVEGDFYIKPIDNKPTEAIISDEEAVLENFLNTFSESILKGETKIINMSKLKEAFEKVKQMFDTTEQKFSDVTLKDGTVIQCDTETLEAGSKVTIMTDGEAMPLPDGTYDLEDGMQFIVVEGVVTELVAPKVAQPEMAEQPNYQSQIDELKATLHNAIELIKDANSKAEFSAKETSEKIKSLFTVVEILANQTPEPTEQRTQTFTSKKDEKINDLKEAFKNLKLK
jgi:hypothetical protein